VKAEISVFEFRTAHTAARILEAERNRPEMGENARSSEREIAFGSLLEPLKNGIYNFIRKSLNFAVQADDVYQETVLHAFRYFNSFQREKSFKAWIFSIACNEIKKYYKNAGPPVSLADIEKCADSRTGDSAALVKEIFRYAARLRPREREVFFLFYESGFTVPEIAGMTGLGESHIKLLLFRARHELKRLLGVDHE
jgi:RNA polymerase sigma-70 factor (ECF subfamily)